MPIISKQDADLLKRAKHANARRAIRMRALNEAKTPEERQANAIKAWKTKRQKLIHSISSIAP